MSMRFNYYHAVFCLLFAACAASCSGQGETGTGSGTVPSIEPRKTVLDPDGGSNYIAVKCDGAWTVDLQFEAGMEPWATMDPASGNGSKGDVRMRYDPNTSTSSRSVTLLLKTGGKTAAKTSVEQLGVGQSQASVGGFKSDTAPVKWLELPATKAGDGRTFYAHDMQGGGYLNKTQSGTRNWSFYWIKNEFLSEWVAYPLNKNLIGSGSRSDAWGLDPLIPESEQPHLITGSYGGGWTRGHQIPSADRLNYKANVSTFYGTNMTPQLYEFNGVQKDGSGGIWARLEGKVREFAGKADTLYVVTGCIIEGSKQNTGGSSGFVVKVPAAYFKALLYLSPNRSLYHKGYTAAGYYLSHEGSIVDDSYTDYIMSIDELEKKTGIDFFVNLPGVVGEKVAGQIESETPGTFWK